MLRPLKVEIRRMPRERQTDFPLPEAATELSAGVDLRAAISEKWTLEPGERALIPTGFAIALPEGYEAQVRPRSGLALRHGVTVLNSPGTIDADYRGEIGVVLINHGKSAFPIKRGDRIAQLVVAPVATVQWKLVKELPDSQRAGGGFGHTGKG